MKGLIIKQPWIDLILSGEKTWEIRGSNTKMRGKIALIQSGTKTVVGYAELKSSKSLCESEYRDNREKHCIIECDQLPYKRTFAWELTNPIRLLKPIPYEHPLGAIVWVNLPDEFYSY